MSSYTMSNPRTHLTLQINSLNSHTPSVYLSRVVRIRFIDVVGERSRYSCDQVMENSTALSGSDQEVIFNSKKYLKMPPLHYEVDDAGHLGKIQIRECQQRKCKHGVLNERDYITLHHNFFFGLLVKRHQLSKKELGD